MHHTWFSSIFCLQKEWLDKIEECKKNFKLKLEQEVIEGSDTELSSEGTVSSSTSTNPFETGTNPFLDNNPFANDDDYDEDKNPFTEKKSTNPFDEDEGWFINTIKNKVLICSKGIPPVLMESMCCFSIKVAGDPTFQGKSLATSS